MGEKKKVDVSGGEGLSQNPFGALHGAEFPEGGASGMGAGGSGKEEKRKAARRGRVDIRLEKSGRGGKVVTLVVGFQGVSGRELDEWGRELRRQCGVGGACKERRIELQGDHRDTVRDYFERRGFRPVFTGAAGSD